MSTQELSPADFSYQLPTERIAKFPIQERDRSKLLVYKNGNIEETIFRDIPTHVPAETILILNNTRVVPVRIIFPKPNSKAVIEIFCLEPVEPTIVTQLALETKNRVIWRCLVGNARRWKPTDLILTLTLPSEKDDFILYAKYIEKIDDQYLIELTWDTDLTFSQVLDICGRLPLPPYIKREVVSIDYQRYQTVFAERSGSVAAPTAGLHFTPIILGIMQFNGVIIDYVTLHIGAGTFKPVTAHKIVNHQMHAEQFSIHRGTIKDIAKHPEKIVAVGTTSMRTLESTYWFGVSLLFEPPNTPHSNPIYIEQWSGLKYADKTLPTRQEAFTAAYQWLKSNDINRLQGYTSLIIAPGVPIMVCDGLVTNFHQPESTLLMLVAAFIGEDWKQVYQYALDHQFRFLSYGDSSLLWKNN